MLRPKTESPAPITWLVQYDDLVDDLHRDLRADLYVDLDEELGSDLRDDVRDEIDVLRSDVYGEIDELRDYALAREAAGALVTEHARRRFGRAHGEAASVRARRVVFVLATVLSLVLVGAVTLLWQRTDTVRTQGKPSVTVAPPDITGVLAHVDQLDQQLAGLLAVSADPAAPSDVAPQIGAVQADLAGIRGCLQAFKRALAADERAVSAIAYC